MDTSARQKQGNVSRGALRLVSVPRTPEQQLDLELAESFAAIEVPMGGKRPRRFYKVAEGELFPGRILARLVDDAWAVCVSPAALLRALVLPIKRLIERKYQKRRLPRRREHKSLPAA